MTIFNIENYLLMKCNNLMELEGGIYMKKAICLLICTLLIGTIILPVTTSIKINFNNLNQTLEIYDDYVPGEFVVKFKEGINLFLSRSNNIMNTGLPSIDELNREFKVYDIIGTITSVVTSPKNPELFK